MKPQSSSENSKGFQYRRGRAGLRNSRTLKVQAGATRPVSEKIERRDFKKISTVITRYFLL